VGAPTNGRGLPDRGVRGCLATALIGGDTLLVLLLRFCTLIYFSRNFTHICLFHQKR